MSSSPPLAIPLCLLSSFHQTTKSTTSQLTATMVRLHRSRRARGTALFHTLQPLATPVLPSLSEETPTFRHRKDEEGARFATELYLTIRNDLFMRDCRCLVPEIHPSKEAAQLASGHLRFYTTDEDTTTLSVIQQPTDHQWHCDCEESFLWPVYRHLLSRSDLNENGKRIAESSELEHGDRVIRAPLGDTVSFSPALINDTSKTGRDTDRLSRSRRQSPSPRPCPRHHLSRRWRALGHTRSRPLPSSLRPWLHHSPLFEI